MSDAKKVCIVGSGNWGSVIAKIVGNNVVKSDNFVDTVPMYVYEEMVDGQKLTEIINTRHENVKYLPGFQLPENVVAVPDVVEAAQGADILVFVVPHQFVRSICRQLQGKIKPGAQAVSLIKGLDISERGLDLISNVIRQVLGIPCAVLMGANIAPEVARENYCEATIGCRDQVTGRLLKEVFEASYFRIVVVEDEQTVELCGALKNVVAVGAGFVDGLKYGDNTKAAVIRLGLMEMVKFCEEFFNNSKIETFLESCGVADLVTTCYSGRNRRVADAYVTSGKDGHTLVAFCRVAGNVSGYRADDFLRICGMGDVVVTCYKGRNRLLAEAFTLTGKTIEQLEAEMLNGQKLQGPPTAAEVYTMLEQKNITERFPMFTAVHKICIGEKPPQAFIDCLKNHPEHMPKY